MNTTPLHEITIPVSNINHAGILRVKMLNAARNEIEQAKFWRERGRADLAKNYVTQAAFYRIAAVRAAKAVRVLIEAGYY